MPGEKVKDLGWFWLTDSWYSIHLGETHLFESSSERIQKYPGNPGKYAITKYDVTGKKTVTNPDEIFALLWQEQTNRKEYFYKILNSVKNDTEHSATHWDEIRQALRQVEVLPKGTGKA